MNECAFLVLSIHFLVIITAPFDIVVNNVTRSQATVCWKSAQNDVISGFFMEYKLLSGTTSTSQKKAVAVRATGQETSCKVIDGLDGWESYQIRVYAFSASERSPYSKATLFEVKPDGEYK